MNVTNHLCPNAVIGHIWRLSTFPSMNVPINVRNVRKRLQKNFCWANIFDWVMSMVHHSNVIFVQKSTIHILYHSIIILHNCFFLLLRFSTLTILRVHMTSLHSGKPQSTEMCYICAKEYKSKASLQWHIMVNHNQDPDRPKLECDICGSW